jgi:hypothetical protein
VLEVGGAICDAVEEVGVRGKGGWSSLDLDHGDIRDV